LAPRPRDGVAGGRAALASREHRLHLAGAVDRGTGRLGQTFDAFDVVEVAMGDQHRLESQPLLLDEVRKAFGLTPGSTAQATFASSHTR